MIESIMFFALGFLAASLIALVLLSAVWHRAVRLTTRRIEGAIPVSMAEIQADKDQLRAEFAMSTRRLEASVEQLKLKATEQLAEIGRKNDSVRQLKAEVEEKTAAITSLEAQERALRDKLRSTEEELSARSRELHETESELAAKNSELAQAARTVSEKTIEADSQRVEIVALETQCETLKHRVSELESDVAAAEERAALERAAVERTARVAAEEREKVDTLSRRVHDQERLLAEARAVADNMARNIASLEAEVRREANLIAERERELAGARAEAARYREETHAARRDAESAARAFNATIETLKSEKAMLEGALVQLREDRTRLQQEVAAYKHQAEAAWASERVENALLRERINDIAAEVARMTASLEGPGSSIDQILDKTANRQNGGPNPAPLAAEAPAEPTEGARLTLAERIRALQARSGR
jgi:predicted  nucleic acid-binding Zn-ribbon protein